MPELFECPSPAQTDPEGAVFLTAASIRDCYGLWEAIPDAAGIFDDSYDDTFE